MLFAGILAVLATDTGTPSAPFPREVPFAVRPVNAPGTVLFGVLDAVSGRLLWSSPTGDGNVGRIRGLRRDRTRLHVTVEEKKVLRTQVHDIRTGRKLYRYPGTAWTRISAGGQSATLTFTKDAVRAVHSDTGRALWTWHGEISGMKVSLSPLPLVMAKSRDRFVGINLDTGRLAWSRKKGPNEYLRRVKDTLWSTDRSRGCIIEVDPASGRDLRRIGVKAGSRASVRWIGDFLVVIHDDRIEALRPGDLGVAWAWTPSEGDLGFCWGYGDTLIAEASGSNERTILDATTGRQRGRISLPEHRSSSSSLSSEGYYLYRMKAADGTTTVGAFDLRNGREAWRGTGDWILTDKTVRSLFVHEKRRVVSIALPGGRTAWTTELPEPPVSQDAWHGRLLYLCAGGVSALDARSGRLHWRTEIGHRFEKGMIGGWPLR